MHCGFGFGIVFINPALEALDWDPPRFTSTAFQNAWVNPVMWNAFMGWIGVDQYDEGNPIGQAFLDRYAEKYDGQTARVLRVRWSIATSPRHWCRAFTDAHPLSPRGVKEALERVKMLPAASGAPGTRVSFGKWTRRAWMGAGYLVARRWMPTASTPISSTASVRKAEPMTTQESHPAAIPGRLDRSQARSERTGGAGSPRSPCWPSSACSSPSRAHGARPAGRETPISTAGRGRSEFLFGFDHWLCMSRSFTILLVVLVVVMFVVRLAAQPRQPGHADVLCTTLIVWQDPIMNWAPYAVYNPDLCTGRRTGRW